MKIDPSWIAELLSLAPAAQEERLAQPGSALSGEIVGALKAQAESASDQGDLPQALALLDLAGKIADGLQQPGLWGEVWKGRANVYQRHDRFEASLAATRLAAGIYQRSGDLFEVARARTVEVYTLGALGRFDQAIALAGWIRRQFHNFPRGQATLSINLAQVYILAWKLEEALAELQEAYDHFMRLNLPKQAARALNNMGWACDEFGRLEQAEAYYRQAYPILIANDDIFVSLTSLHNLALVCLRQGRFEETQAILAEARQKARQITDPTDSAYLDLYEGRVRRALSQPEQAEALLRRALNGFSRPGYVLEQAEARLELGRLMAEGADAGRPAEGLELLQQAGEALEGYPSVIPLTQVQMEQGEFLLRLGRRADAARLAEAVLHSLAGIKPPLRLRQATAQALLADSLGRAQPERARELYAAATAQANADLPLLSVRCRYGLAQIEAEAGNLAAAEAAYIQALDALEKLERAFTSHRRRAGFKASYAKVAAELLEVLRRQPEHAARLLHWAERFKAQALADWLVNAPPDLSSTPALEILLLERQRLRTALDQHMLVLGAAPCSGAMQRSAALLSDDRQAGQLADLRQALQTVQETIDRQKDAALQWREAAWMDSEQALRLFDEDTLLVSYFATSSGLYAISASAKDIQVHKMGAGLQEVESLWEHTRRSLTRLGPLSNIQPRLARLWEILIAPLAERLEDGQRLLISPYGSLFQIPLAILYNPRRREYLVERHSIQGIPSLNILGACHSQASGRGAPLLVGYAGEPGQAGYLPGVLSEIEALAGLFPDAELRLGEAANVEALLSEAPGRGVIHLAGHAYYDPQQPLESGMPLAGGGWLRAGDLYLQRGRLGGALVILSGCEAALGRTTGGETLGLSSAFLYAGATAVIAGLWRVDDAAASALMAGLYRALRGGSAAAEALQTAQLDLLRRPDWRHPFYWGAFQLNGDNRSLA